MGMHEDWKAAKKTSEDNFKLAYEDWIAKTAPAAKRGDPKAKKIMLDDALKNAGLDKGPKYTSYLKFDEGFGKELDKIEKVAEAFSKVDNLKLADVLKDKKLSALFQNYCATTAHVSENYDFVTSGCKMRPQQIYNTYITPESEKQLNLDDSDVAAWRACAESGDWTPAEKLRKEVLAKVVPYLDASFKLFLKHKKYRPVLLAAMGKGTSDKDKQIEKVRTIATDYARQVQAYGKRWKDLTPDFWTPLNKTLNDILAKVDTLAKA
jgi:hypothetical protein